MAEITMEIADVTHGVCEKKDYGENQAILDNLMDLVEKEIPLDDHQEELLLSLLLETLL